MYVDIECGTKIAELKIDVGEFVGYCPVCGNKLVVKEGRFGKFVGCEGYKTWWNCKKTYNYGTFKLTNYDALAHHNTERERKYLKKEITKYSLKNLVNYDARKVREIIENTNYGDVKSYGERVLRDIYEFEEWDATH